MGARARWRRGSEEEDEEKEAAAEEEAATATVGMPEEPEEKQEQQEEQDQESAEEQDVPMLIVRSAVEGRDAVVAALMEAGGAVDMTDSDSWTPLHYAAAGGHPTRLWRSWCRVARQRPQ